MKICTIGIFFFSSRRRHTRYWRDWSSDVCSSDLELRESRDERLRRVALGFDGGEVLRGARFETLDRPAGGVLPMLTDPRLLFGACSSDGHDCATRSGFWPVISVAASCVAPSPAQGSCGRPLVRPQPV